MRKIIYNRELFILHKKRSNPSYFHDNIEKELYDSHSKKIIMLDFLSIVLFFA